MHAKLIPITGTQAFRLTQRVIVIGRREKACGIYLDDLRVSRVHCVIRETDDGELELRDLGSTNGTRINGHKVTEGLLLHGDEIAFARERFRLSIDEQARKDAETEIDKQRKTDTIDENDKPQPRESEVVVLEQSDAGELDLSGDVSKSDSVSDASGEGTRKRIVLELPRHMLPSDDDDENTVLEPPSREPSHTRHDDTIVAKTEPARDAVSNDSRESDIVIKPSIHPCPGCLQTQMVESSGRWWHIPLRLLLLRPYKCPNCNAEHIRLNV